MGKSILKRVLRIISIVMIIGIVMHLFLANQKIFWQDMGFASMSTFVKFRFYVRDQQSAAPAAQTVRAAFMEMNQLCNRFDPESELSKLNRTAYSQPFTCSEKLWSLLMDAKKMYEISGGAFDITVAPLMRHWRTNRTEPVKPSEEIMKQTGLDKVIFNEADRTVRFTVEGMSLDLGGIAKGAALDLAKEKLKGKKAVGTKWSEDVSLLDYLDAKFRNRVSEMKQGYIDVGGNVLTLEEAPPKQDSYTVGVRNPVDASAKPVATASILNESVSTSGNYERYVTINGKQYTHIIDPRTGMPVENMLSVTVITKRAADADALSTAIFIRGREPGFLDRIRTHYPDMRMLMFFRNQDGKICTESIGSWQDLEIPK